ncbi:uncharacterized protein LOC106737393 [Alligator mississippiensis]|uniref:uncharacterized protein LOC106737393 n=1 Tax=Alligator mississippiensis TaxID=8496 RepID=UPI0006EC975E|nr:uncharacterized protein LOC106737393 [Alligator mississippiensis]
MASSSPTLLPATRGANWSMEETGDLVALWGEEDVQRQFALGGRSNVHVYEGLACRMRERGYDRTAQQCRIKVKALRAQWVSISDHNRRSGSARKTMPFMRQLDAILTPRDPSCIHAHSTGSLAEPPPQAGIRGDGSPGEGPSGRQQLVQPGSPAAASTSSSGSLAQCLPQQLHSLSPSQEAQPAMSPLAISSASSSPGGAPIQAPVLCAPPSDESAGSLTLLLPARIQPSRRVHQPRPRGPAVACGGEAARGNQDVGSESPPPTAGALRMRRLRQRRSQDRTLRLDRLVTASEDRLVDTRAWRVEDVARQERWRAEDVVRQDRWRAEDVARQDARDRREEVRDRREEARDQAEREFRTQFLTLEREWVEALREQSAVLGRAVQAMEDNRRVLDTLMALAVALVPPADRPRARPQPQP